MGQQSRTREYALARPEPLLRVADVQELLACSRRTVYTLIASGQLQPLYVVDSHPRFDPENIRSLIASGRREPSDHAA